MAFLSGLGSFGSGQVGSLYFRRSGPWDAHRPQLEGIRISLGSVGHLVYRRMRRLSTKRLSARVAGRQYRLAWWQMAFVGCAEALVWTCWLRLEGDWSSGQLPCSPAKRFGGAAARTFDSKPPLRSPFCLHVGSGNRCSRYLHPRLSAIDFMIAEGSYVI